MGMIKTFFISDKDKDITKSLISSEFKIVKNQCFESYMVLNPEKCHFMCVDKNISDSELCNFIDLNLENCKEV